MKILKKRKRQDLVRIIKDYVFCIASILAVLIIGIVLKTVFSSDKEEMIIDKTETLVVIENGNTYKPEESIFYVSTLEYKPEKSIFFRVEETDITEIEYNTEYENVLQYAFYDYEVNENVPLDAEVQKQVQALCKEYEVPYEIVLGVMEAESSFRDWIVASDCYGLMMIHSCNFAWLEKEIGITDLLDPVQNAHAGIYILKGFYEKYGDWHKALVCYNCGEGGAEKYVFQYGYTSSKYSEKCLKYAEKWNEVLSND